MAVIVTCDDPRGLLSRIMRAIDQGDVKTWAYDDDSDFTHTAEQWVRRAWFRPRVLEDRLVLNIFPPRGRSLTRYLYGVYHGRFVEMLLNHFDSRFERAITIAMPTALDRVGYSKGGSAAGPS